MVGINGNGDQSFAEEGSRLDSRDATVKFACSLNGTRSFLSVHIIARSFISAPSSMHKKPDTPTCLTYRQVVVGKGNLSSWALMRRCGNVPGYLVTIPEAF